MRFSAAVLVLALAAWMAALAAAGTAAMAAFGSLPHQQLSSDALRPYFGDATDEVGRFVAGRMMQPVFLAGDWAQYAAAALAVGSAVRLLRLGGMHGPRWARAALLAAIGVAAAILAWRAWSMPAMSADLVAYWDGVLANDRAVAEAAKARFDGAHRAAEAGMQAQLFIVLAAIPLGVLAVVPSPRRGHGAAEDGFRG